MRKSIIGLVWLFALVSGLPACAGFMYSAEPMEARVIDAETKQPLDGVIVVAHWQLERGTPGGSVPAGQLAVMETVTDKQGRFAFPGFGPKLAVTSHLVNKDPELILFQSGYRYRALTNEYSGAIELRTRTVRRSEWDGKMIELKLFKGNMEEYAKHLSSMPLSWAYNGDDCEWKKIPRLVTAIHEQAMMFRRQSIMANLYTIENLIPYPGYPDKCGAREYFKERRP
jgi:hypothetical protein